MTRVKVSVTQNDLTCYLISGRVFRYYPVVMVVGVFQMVVRGFRQNWSIFSAPLPVFTDCNSFLSLMCLLCPVKVENIRLDKSFVVGGISRTFYFSLFLVFFPKSNGTFLYSFYLLYKQAATVKLFSLMLFEAFYLFICWHIWRGCYRRKNGTSLLRFLSCVSQKHVATRFNRLYIYLKLLLNYSCTSNATSNSTN